MAGMTEFKTVPYEPLDNAAALLLEEKCVQGKSIVLKFQRPTYDARSKVYDKVLGRFFRFPHIPRQGEDIHSWFLFDFYAGDKEAAVNNYALTKSRTYLYILLQSDGPMVEFLKGAGLKIFTLPYFYMAKGRVISLEKDRLYSDVRDL